MRRRNIFKVAAAYAVMAWLLTQVAVTMETALGLPDTFDAVIVSTILIGFPIALILAWAFELTPSGVVRTPVLEEETPSIAQRRRRTGRRLMGVIGVGLVLALSWFAIARVDRAGVEPLSASSVAPEDAPSALIDAAPPESTIAVLRFADFSPDQDQGYFANGIVEEISNALSRIAGLRVSSRTSSFALAERNASVAEIGQTLNVAHVLEGSVRKAGGTLRISATLVGTQDEREIWSESYDRPLSADNIFAIQDEITDAIVTELRGRLDIDTSGRTTARTRSIEAYDLYLRALDRVQTRTPDSLQAAITAFEEVIRMEPDFAPAHAGLADAHLLTFTYSGVFQSDAQDRAAPHVARALELAPDLPEALVAAADLARLSGDNARALDFVDRAIAVNPSFAYAYQRRANILLRLARPEEARAAIERAVALDPLSPVLLSVLATSQYRDGDFDAALATAAENRRWNPDRPYGYFTKGLIDWVTGDLAGGHADLQRAYARSPKSFVIRGNLSGLYMDAGLMAQSRAMAGGENGQARFEAVAGDPEIARRTAETLNPREAADLYFTLRDFEKAAPAIPPVVTSLTSGGRLDIDGAYLAARALTAADRLDRVEDAQVIAAGLRDYLDGRRVNQLRDAVTIYAATALALYEGKTERAFALIDRAHALNIPLFILSKDPVFDALQNEPGFAQRVARQAEIAAEHRAAIEVQLANPEEGWLVIDTGN